MNDPNYLSNMRPDFEPFEIDCGKLPAYRFKGSLKKELKSGRVSAKDAIAMFEDMLMVREFEEMIVIPFEHVTYD